MSVNRDHAAIRACGRQAMSRKGRRHRLVLYIERSPIRGEAFVKLFPEVHA
jgi:hypothetical protein